MTEYECACLLCAYNFVRPQADYCQTGEDIFQKHPIRVGVDASNIRAGGGVQYLSRLLEVANPPAFGISLVKVWAGQATLRNLPDRPWLERVHIPALDRALSHRLYWQKFKLDRLASPECNVLFVPGGIYSGVFRPFVTVSLNMLPFQTSEMYRYGFSWTSLRLSLIRIGQIRTFKNANGVIFLNRYVRDVIVNQVGSIRGATQIAPLGVSSEFFCTPRPRRDLNTYSMATPFRILYVSIVNEYKHQWNVAEAVHQLHEQGFPIALDLVGPAYKPSLKRLERTIRQRSCEAYVTYHGVISFDRLLTMYHTADAFVFASTCENMPNILLEAMASGLPIACSRYGPMPEILRDGGIYFDPIDVYDITNALKQLLTQPDNRAFYAARAYEIARQYSWKRCAHETFEFLAKTAKQT